MHDVDFLLDLEDKGVKAKRGREKKRREMKKNLSKMEKEEKESNCSEESSGKEKGGRKRKWEEESNIVSIDGCFNAENIIF